MTAYFADSFYFLALLNPADSAHEAASGMARDVRRPLVTTAWVLTEVGDAMAAPFNRPIFLKLVEGLRKIPTAEVIPASQELFERGIELFARRLDKSWSLTDCVSFVVMTDRGLTDALTGDRHFEQAGFRAMLREK